MTIIDSGFSEKAAERIAVAKDRVKVAAYIVKRVEAMLADCQCGNLRPDDVAGIAEEIKNGAHDK